jgi:hypothetical protein
VNFFFTVFAVDFDGKVDEFFDVGEASFDAVGVGVFVDEDGEFAGVDLVSDGPGVQVANFVFVGGKCAADFVADGLGLVVEECGGAFLDKGTGPPKDECGAENAHGWVEEGGGEVFASDKGGDGKQGGEGVGDDVQVDGLEVTVMLVFMRVFMLVIVFVRVFVTMVMSHDEGAN